MIKVLLVGAGLILCFYLLRHRGSAHVSAGTRSGFLLFVLFGIYGVLRPSDIQRIAEAVGIGRGADLVLYALVVLFGFFAVSTSLRFRDAEIQYARLARAIALATAEPGAVEEPESSS